MNIKVFGAHEQGFGMFDGGKIVEQKPIAFPHEDTAVSRVGPLFYWAWGFSNGGGLLPFHPHQAFEIMSYMIEGNVTHKDTLGTESTVGAGGAQVMQTGTGMYHEESSFGDHIEGFQIWFEPNLQESVKMQPTYRQFEHHDFPLSQIEGSEVKTIIGDDSPVTLITDAKMWDIKQEQNSSYRRILPAGYSWALLVIRGNGQLTALSSDQVTTLLHKDFAVIESDVDTELIFKAQAESTRIIIIEVPTETPYRLYPKKHTQWRNSK
ncbi:pirin family protein [Paenibacillus aestuarii]|uniref:Pirin family protein n=1 Tax=Paenibacillus aestuarii TaxID=516965 RepID=A0ABW0KB97_9BACL|nr:pirin family protein [Paenibacillus aestuarii]